MTTFYKVLHAEIRTPCAHSIVPRCLLLLVAIVGVTSVCRVVVADEPVARIVEPLKFKAKPQVLGAPASHGSWPPAFSPDSKLLLVPYGHFNCPGEMRVWDLETQEPRFTYYESRGVRPVTFSPDGETFVAGAWNGKITFRSVATGELQMTLDEVKGELSSVQYTPDGKELITCGWSKLVRFWDPTTGKELRRYTGHTEMLYGVAQSKLGAIASCSRDHTAILWDVKTGKPKRKLAHPDDVHQAVFTRDGSTLLTVCYDGSVRFWDVETGKLDGEPLRVHNGRALGIDTSPDGKQIVTVGDDRLVKLWDLETRKEVGEAAGHTSKVVGVQFSPDGRMIATCDQRMETRLWKTAKFGDGSTLLKRPQVGPLGFVSVATSPNSQVTAIVTEANEVQLLDRKGSLLRTLANFDDAVNAVEFSPNGKSLVTASFDTTVQLWDVKTGELQTTFKGHSNWVYGVSFSADGKRLASCSYDETIRVWDVTTGKEIGLLEGHEAAVCSCKFSPNGRWLVSGSADQTIRIWDAKTFEERQVLKGHDGTVWCVALSPDGKTIASASDDKSARVWSLEKAVSVEKGAAVKSQFAIRGHLDAVLAVAISPNGKTLATAGADKTVRTWSLTAGVFRQQLSGHADTITSLSFRSDGTALLSSGMDQAVRVWQAITVPSTK